MTSIAPRRGVALLAAAGAVIREWLPRDPRSVVLGTGFAAMAALGLVGVLDGDSLGYAYLSSAAAGIVFVQARGIPAVIWLLVSAGGLWAVEAGSTAGWVQVGAGVGLAGLALLPVRNAQPASKPESQGNLTKTASSLEVSQPTAVVVDSIQTFGRLRILAGGEDLVPLLLDKRVLGFIWCTLLVAALRTPGGGVQRAQLASEFSPGPNRRAQVERLRRQLWDVQHDLPTSLSGLVRIDRTYVRVDLEHVDCDLFKLRQLADRVATEQRGADLDLVAQIRRFLEVTSGQFLPEFDELARAAHQSRGSAMQAVAELRNWVLQTRISLGHYLARHEQLAISTKE